MEGFESKHIPYYNILVKKEDVPERKLEMANGKLFFIDFLERCRNSGLRLLDIKGRG